MGTSPDWGIRAMQFSTCRLHLCAALLVLLSLTLPHPTLAQDGSTSLQGVVEDISGARIAAAVITVVDPARGFRLKAVADAQGQFIFGMLSPGRYDVSAAAPGMITKTTHGVELYVGGVSVVQVRGTNNVFFDPSSPMTSYAESGNGSETVQTESLAASLTSAWTNNLASNLRAQFSRDVQQSTANSEEPRTKIYNLISGFGRSSMLPRNTREHKLHLADTLS